MAGFFSLIFRHDTRPQQAIIEKVNSAQRELMETRSILEETIEEFLSENDRHRKGAPQNVSKHRS
jgi:hypothetical protein